MAPAAQAKKEEESDDEGLWYGSDTSDDEMEEPSGSTRPRTRNRGHTKPSEFVTGLVLTTPRMMQMNVQNIYDDVMDNTIDLEPDYQRGVVWTKPKQSAVIESLLSHYYVPPILLSEKREGGQVKYTCIDGKQRMSSIKLFMNNEIPVRDAKGTSFFFNDPVRRSLPPEVAKRFKKEGVPAVIYTDLRDEEEREMFQRVQMGVTLSAAEKLSALRNPWTIFIDELSKKYMDTDNDGYNLSSLIGTNRSQDWMSVGQVATSIHNGKTIFVPNFGPMRVLFDRDIEGPSLQLQDTVRQTMVKFIKIANDGRFSYCVKPRARTGTTSQKLSPVEFAQVGWLLWRWPQATMAELAEWIDEMRDGLHAAAPSQVRMNTFCVTWCRNFIESKRPQSGNDTPKDTPSGSSKGKSSGGGGNSNNSKKRTAAAVIDDEVDDLYETPAPAKRQVNGVNGAHASGSSSSGSGSRPVARPASSSARSSTASTTNNQNRLFNMSPSPPPQQQQQQQQFYQQQQQRGGYGDNAPLVPRQERSTPRNPYL